MDDKPTFTVEVCIMLNGFMKKKMVHIATQYEFYTYCKAKAIKHAYNICERIKGMGRKGQEQRQEIIVNF